MLYYVQQYLQIAFFYFGIKEICILIMVFLCTIILGEVINSWKFFLPVTYFFIPYILLLQFLPIWNSLNLVTNLLILHIGVTIPLLSIDRIINNWRNKNILKITENARIYMIQSPMIYFDFALGLLYPYIFGIIIISIRYLTMGKIIDMSFLFTDVTLRIGFLLLCYLPFFVWLFSKLAKIYAFIRLYLWTKLTNILYSIHLFLLNYWYDYFICCSKLHKFMFFIHSFCTRISKTKWPKNPNKFWLFIEKIYLYPQYCTFFVFFLIFLEILVSKQINKCLYLLFFYVCIRSIFSNLYSFGQTHFGFDCCFANYLYNNYINPRFPIAFWNYFDIREEVYKIKHTYSLAEEICLQQERDKHIEKLNFYKKHVNFKTLIKIYTKKNITFLMSIAFLYYFFYHYRY